MANSNGVIIQSIARAAEILECFSGGKKELGISDIAEAMDLSKSTIYGLINTLTVYGFLDQNKENKKYRLGIKLFELGNIVKSRIDLRAEARTYLEDLVAKYRHTVHLAALYDDKIVYIDKVDGPDVVLYSRIGKTAPMHCTGVGKAILAFMPESFIKNKLEGKLESYTSNTVTDRNILMKELENITLKGYSEEKEEIEYGLRCIAAPIFNDKGTPVAAVSISALIGRMANEDVPGAAEDVKQCALKISQRLGYSNR